VTNGNMFHTFISLSEALIMSRVRNAAILDNVSQFHQFKIHFYQPS